MILQNFQALETQLGDVGNSDSRAQAKLHSSLLWLLAYLGLCVFFHFGRRSWFLGSNTPHLCLLWWSGRLKCRVAKERGGKTSLMNERRSGKAQIDEG